MLTAYSIAAARLVIVALCLAPVVVLIAVFT